MSPYPIQPILSFECVKEENIEYKITQPYGFTVITEAHSASPVTSFIFKPPSLSIFLCQSTFLITIISLFSRRTIVHTHFTWLDYIQDIIIYSKTFVCFIFFRHSLKVFLLVLLLLQICSPACFPLLVVSLLLHFLFCLILFSSSHFSSFVLHFSHCTFAFVKHALFNKASEARLCLFQGVKTRCCTSVWKGCKHGRPKTVTEHMLYVIRNLPLQTWSKEPLKSMSCADLNTI